MARTLFLTLPLCCWLLVTIGMPAQAQTQGSRQIVNPFETGNQGSAAGSGRYATRISDEEESAFRLPSFRSLPKPSLPKINLVPDWRRAPASGPTRPSMWDKINGGTKSLLGKTKRTLMPWSVKDDKPSSSSISSRYSGRSNSASKPRSGAKTFFSSWFKPKEKEKEIKTVNEWLSLPTVPYD